MKELIKRFLFASLRMIDEETRRRILELWRAGHTKKAIAAAVNVSLPTVRKYIREAKAERTSDNKRLNATAPERVYVTHRSETTPIPIVIRDNSFPPGTRFIVNIEINTPYGNNDPWTCLNNGLPIFDLKRVLGKVMGPVVVRKIMEEVNRLGGAGWKYEVSFRLESVLPVHGTA